MAFLFGGIANLAYNERRSAIDRAQDANAISARLLSEHLFRVFRTSDAILGHLTEKTMNSKGWGNAGDFQTTTHSLIHSFQEISFVLLIGADGALKATSESLDTPNINYGDRAYFKAHLAGADTTIGAPLISRSTGKSIIPVTRAVRNRDGTFAGVILTAVETTYLDGVLDGARHDADDAVALFRTDGTVLARQPPIGVGFQFAAARPLSLSKETASGVTEDVSPIDGRDRLIAFTTVNDYPLLVVVSQAKDSVLAPWRGLMVKLAVTTAALSMVILLIARFAFGAIRREEKALLDLRISKDQMASLVDAAPEGIIEMTKSGEVTFINDEALRILGHSRAAVVGKDLHTLIHHSYADGSPYPITACRMREALRSGRRHTVSDEVFWRADGTAVPIEYVVGLMATSEGSSGALILFRNIAERKRAEQSIHDLLARQNAILANTPIGIALIGLDRNIIEANDDFCRVYGREGESLAGQSASILYADPTQYEEIGQRAYPLVRRGETFRGDVHMCRRDGSEVWVRLEARLVDVNAPDLGAVWAAEDITARKVMELDLRRSNNELERFAYVASHDLRQPLRMISSYLGMIGRRLSGQLDGELGEFLDFAIDGAKRLDGMIVDLLDYSRIGRQGAAPEMVPLDSVLANALANLEGAIADAGAEVAVAPGLPIILGHESELERLFQNLIANAIKFRSPERSPKVTVECQEMVREWVFAVSDNGIGIAPEDQSRLFVVFQRLVSREQYDGTGIGLAACRKICEHHGGRIWLDSAPGVGTTVLIALPKGSGDVH